MGDRDWESWHDAYDVPGSYLERRLRVVQKWVAATLDSGAARVVSLCAGQGRDLLPVLAAHPRREQVRARLVELDERNVAAARRAAPPGVEVVCGDAASLGAYDGAVPADLVLACGVFGNVSDDDIRRTVGLLPQLCAPEATVIWTRHRREPDLVPRICGWFEGGGFERVTVEGDGFGVGVHRYAGPPAALEPGERMFTFR
ncbi:SAM-dependent methyltransferase [Nonomuraea phyllanthi]|uniref:SAM-dependent methyltransferase n=1 Tax=Nonomuraea phyllanthi TaxID=2219224 RepID=A0A5C4WJS4_9ACTN|nr:SAM-dependent methyltransferase [Nonomuraea phyllanthi]KAB8194480.1 SAM-dependent methyltransferase [Nonomuraea phyllanthi]QFY08908.1 SAM-dependent methyltransferase [Nonomuraea phyllanthi]